MVEMCILLFLTVSLSNLENGHSWIIPHDVLKPNHRRPNRLQHALPSVLPMSLSSPSSSSVPSTIRKRTTSLYGVIDPLDYPLGKDEETWKSEGERIIQKAAVEAGASQDQIKIEWKAGRIVVTVDGGYAYVKPRDPDDGEENFGDGGEDFDDINADAESEIEIESEIDDGLGNNLTDEDDGANVISIARKINAAFAEEGEDSIGFRIAVHHSVDVTTPGASNELHGIMFESYKGFDVIVEMIDTKTKKKKIIEGRLVERNEELTILNQKGRLRKLKNYNVQSVKLPKAKREKGVR